MDNQSSNWQRDQTAGSIEPTETEDKQTASRRPRPARTDTSARVTPTPRHFGHYALQMPRAWFKINRKIATDSRAIRVKTRPVDLASVDLFFSVAKRIQIKNDILSVFLSSERTRINNGFWRRRRQSIKKVPRVVLSSTVQYREKSAKRKLHSVRSFYTVEL